MRTILIIIAATCFAGTSYGQYLQWAYTMGIEGQASRALAVTTDAAGYIYTAGTYKGQLDFDPGSDSDKIAAARFSDAFIQKMDPTGNYVKTYVFGRSDNSYAVAGAIKFDASGDLYIAGYFTGNNVDFDPDTSEYKLSDIGSGNDAYIMKMDATGKFLWARHWDYNKDAGGANNTLEEGPAMDLDGSGNIYCAGQFLGTVDFDPDTSTYKMTALQGDGYVSKFDGDGNFLWAKQIVADTTQSKFVVVKSVSADASGNVFVAGYFIGTADFNPDTTVVYSLAATSQQGFILKLDASGNFLWAKKIGKEAADPILNYNTANAVLTDAAGNAYVTGSYMESVDFGTIQRTSEGLSDIFIAKLDASGNYLWVQSAGTFYDGEYGYRLAFDGVGNLIVTGNYHGTLTFSGNSISTNGDADIFVLKLTPQGNVTWLKGFGGSSYYERVQSVATHGNDVYTVGRMIGTVNFDPNGHYDLTTGSSNKYYPNFFIQKMTQWPTGVPDVSSQLEAAIFPNPATNQFTIDFAPSGLRDADMMLLDMQGRKVLETTIKGTSGRVNVEGLAKGVYLVKVQTQDGYAAKRLIIE